MRGRSRCRARCLGELKPEELLAGAANIIELVVEYTSLLLIYKLLQTNFGLLFRHRHALDMLAHVLEVLAAFALSGRHYLRQLDAGLRAQACTQQLYFQRNVVLFALHLRTEQRLTLGAMVGWNLLFEVTGAGGRRFLIALMGRVRSCA